MKKYSFHIWFLVSILLFELLIMSNFLPYNVVWKSVGISFLGMLIVYSANVFFLFPKYFNTISIKSNWKYISITFLLILSIAISFTFWEHDINGEFRPRRNERIHYPLLFPMMGRFMGLFIIQLIGTFSLVLERLSHQVQQTEKARSDYYQSELKLLKTQVNPHFLFNALNNIYSLSYMKSDDAPKSVLRLSNMLRHVLREDEQDEVELKSELQYIEDYIAFQQLRMPENGNVSFEQNIDNEHIRLPQMLLMPFVENSFKYSRVEEEEQGAFISIFVHLKNTNLHFNIKNSQPSNKVPSGNKTGIKNVRKRLDILYPKKYKLDIINEQESFEVNLLIELS